MNIAILSKAIETHTQACELYTAKRAVAFKISELGQVMGVNQDHVFEKSLAALYDLDLAIAKVINAFNDDCERQL